MLKIINVIKTISSKCQVLGFYLGFYTWFLEKVATIFHNQKLENKKHDIIERFLVNNYFSKVIKSNMHESIGIKIQHMKKTPVWVLWYQGENYMPPLVKACYNNIVRLENSDSTQVYLLTENNISDFVNLPVYIYKKVESKEISLTHFSDILRFALLYNYGGVWVDSTVWLTEPIKDEYFSYKYWSIKLDEPKFTISITKYKWSGFFFLISRRQDNLAKFVINFLLEYWAKESKLIDYLLIDYIIDIARLKFDDVRVHFEEIPFSNKNLYELYKVMSDEFNQTLYERVIKDTQLFKLSYKRKYREYSEKGNVTFYSVIIKK